MGVWSPRHGCVQIFGEEKENFWRARECVHIFTYVHTPFIVFYFGVCLFYVPFEDPG